MAKSTETGHVKNVTNFKTLITIIEGLGTEYAPSEESIQLPALNGMYAEANGSIKDLTTAMPVYTTAVDEQEAAYEPLSRLVTRVGSAHAAVATKQSIETVESLKKAINGKRPKSPTGEEAAKLAEAGKEADIRSTSQRSYDNLQQNFEELIQTVAANPKYKPNEPDLKVAALSAYSASLKAKTEAVDIAYNPVTKARNKRNKVLYTEETGVLDKVKQIKSYLKSVYGPSSPQMKQVNGLAFRENKK